MNQPGPLTMADQGHQWTLNQFFKCFSCSPPGAALAAKALVSEVRPVSGGWTSAASYHGECLASYELAVGMLTSAIGGEPWLTKVWFFLLWLIRLVGGFCWLFIFNTVLGWLLIDSYLIEADDSWLGKTPMNLGMPSMVLPLPCSPQCHVWGRA